LPNRQQQANENQKQSQSVLKQKSSERASVCSNHRTPPEIKWGLNLAVAGQFFRANVYRFEFGQTAWVAGRRGV